MPITFNTSNLDKQRELASHFERLGYKIRFESRKIPEICSSHVDVVTHKASSVTPGVLVEDVSLEVEGGDLGVQVKHRAHLLPTLSGRKAAWIVLLAQARVDEPLVDIYRGCIEGRILSRDEVPLGKHIDLRQPGQQSFDKYFWPDGVDHSLAYHKPDSLSARWLTVFAWHRGHKLCTRDRIDTWDGKYQDS
ncbi:MAG: hypothetical protein VXY77_04110 [Pseudomonadota bacterium]|nr:hypothetical protein [Pseudomonadota bacterium]